MTRKRILTDEEMKLWQKVTAKDKPLETGSNPSKDQFEQELNRGAPKKQAKNGGSPVANAAQQKKDLNNSEEGRQLRSHDIGSARQVSRNGQAQTDPGTFNRLELRRLGTGVYDIDARLDLHGLRQMQARRKLFSFLRSCQQDGARFVLVITGKGGREHGSRPKGSSRFDEDLRLPWEQDQSEGVLKTMVPMWLGEPDFARLVVRWSQAGPHHGGQGALYIHVRRG